MLKGFKLVDLLVLVIVFTWLGLGIFCFVLWQFLEIFIITPEFRRIIVHNLKYITYNTGVQQIQKSPVACCIALLCTTQYFLRKFGGIGPNHVNNSYNNIFKDKEYWRLLVGQFTHGQILHLIFNMWALLCQCVVESTIGSWNYFKMSVMLLLVSGMTCLGIFPKIAKWNVFKNEKDELMVGYSSVLYAWGLIIKGRNLIEIPVPKIIIYAGNWIYTIPIDLIFFRALSSPHSFLYMICGITSSFVGVGIFNWVITSDYKFGLILLCLFLGMCFQRNFYTTNTKDFGKEVASQSGVVNSEQEHED